MNIRELRRFTTVGNNVEIGTIGPLEAAERNGILDEYIAKTILACMERGNASIREISEMIITLCHINKNTFAEIALMATYAQALEFGNDEARRMAVSYGAKANLVDTDKYRRIVQAFLLSRIPVNTYVKEIIDFKKQYKISDKFHDNLYDILASKHESIVIYIIEYIKRKYA